MSRRLQCSDMLKALVLPAPRVDLWPALLIPRIDWTDVPSAGLMLSGGFQLLHSATPDGRIPHLKITLYASESLQPLLDSEGPYTQEELADPYAVIHGYWVQALEFKVSVTDEASGVLGKPDMLASADWLRADRTISVGIMQADVEEPIEVCAWLLPPGRTADDLRL